MQQQLEQNKSICMRRRASHMLWQSLNGRLLAPVTAGGVLPHSRRGLPASSCNSNRTVPLICHSSSSCSSSLVLQQCNSMHSSHTLCQVFLATATPVSRISSSRIRRLAVPAAAQAVPSEQQASIDLTPEQQANVAVYLSELSDEQQRAAYCTEQHARVIAVPGSGKTRVVAARVARLIATGVEPQSLLVITFTRKAAGELVDRLKAILGPEVTSKLMPCTFHSLCSSLLRRYPHLTAAKGFQVASEEDCEDTIRAILTKHYTTDVKKPAKETEAKEATMRVPNKDVKWFRRSISFLKNFTMSIKGRSGKDLINEVTAKGRSLSHHSTFVARLAAVYDEYVETMAASKQLDFDDLLHNCLALVKDNPGVKAAIHQRWQHVLVDESQDTNACQFDLVKQLTGKNSCLFMVGDPDQAIYGFRGANSKHLSKEFLQHYGSTAVTFTMADNYRSREPIVQVADMVRSSYRPSGALDASARSLRSQVRPDTVMLLEAQNEYDEADQAVMQLLDWKRHGYAWQEMAMLFRNKDHMLRVYSKAIEAGIPCTKAAVDFFEAAEIKIAVALLRLLVDPSHAAESLKRRIIKKGSGVKIPLADGLGEAFLEKLQQHIEANPESMPWLIQQQQPEQQQQQLPLSLGNCLLGDLAVQPTNVEALQVSQQWMAVQQAADQGCDLATVEQLQPQQQLHVLAGLAPPWRKPDGFKGVTKKQQAVIDRLRGLVLLGRVQAMAGSPAHVVQLLLNASGILPELKLALRAGPAAEKKEKSRRRNNLKSLIILAGNVDVYARDPALLLEDFDVDDIYSSSMPSSSSSSSDSIDELEVASTGIPVLQKFYDYCALQGEPEEQENKDKVQLLTMHKSKGLEFPCVVIMRAHEGCIPSIRPDELLTAEMLEQERNLLYVAITRAKEHCLITWPREYYSKWAPGSVGGGSDEVNEVSSLLKPVITAAQDGRLPGVQTVQRRFVELRSSSGGGGGSRSSAVWRGRGSSWDGVGSSSSSSSYGSSKLSSDVIHSSRGGSSSGDGSSSGSTPSSSNGSSVTGSSVVRSSRAKSSQNNSSSSSSSSSGDIVRSSRRRQQSSSSSSSTGSSSGTSPPGGVGSNFPKRPPRPLRRK